MNSVSAPSYCLGKFEESFSSSSPVTLESRTLGRRSDLRTFRVSSVKLFNTPAASLNCAISLSHSSTCFWAKSSVQKSSSQSWRSSSEVLPCCSTQVKYLKLCSALRSK